MFATRRRSDLLSQLLLESLVFGDINLPSALAVVACASRPFRTLAAVGGVETDLRSQLECLLLAVRARDDFSSKVDVEGALREETAVRLCPRLAHDRASGIRHRSNV